MEYLQHFIDSLPRLLTSLSVILMVLVALWIANWILLRRSRDYGEDRRFTRRVIMFVVTIVGIVIILLAFPVGDETRNQLVALVGLITTAAIALASTTFVANAMAGLMLRTVRSFRAGDFVMIGDHFGRVTERGLFHTEIQTEDRDLTTLPNLYLVSNPLKVVRASGTIVSARVSLGYDLPRQEVRELLLAAAEEAGLNEPYIQIEELGDFSITYRVAGLLPEVKQLLTARSTLRSKMLDSLHGAGMEIVSPSFMNQRQLQQDSQVIPPDASIDAARNAADLDDVPEEMIFDKAEEAGRIEQLRAERDALLEDVAGLQQSMKSAPQEDRATLEHRIKTGQDRCQEILEELGENDA